MDGAREARLRPEYALLYPDLPSGWQPAARIADQVAERLIVRRGYTALKERVLPAEHFDYRGQLPGRIEPGGRRRRLADRMS